MGLVIAPLLAGCGARTGLQYGAGESRNEARAGFSAVGTGDRSSGGDSSASMDAGTTGGAPVDAEGGTREAAYGAGGGAGAGAPSGAAGTTVAGEDGGAVAEGGAGAAKGDATGGSAGALASLAGAGGAAHAGAAGQFDTALLVIEPVSLASARLNKAYAAQLSAIGGTGAGYRFEVSGGTLPSGLTLSTEGRLAGVPEQLGEFQFTAMVTDSSGSQAFRELVLHVGRTRWVSAVTMISSASSQTLTVIQNLDDTEAPLITLETWNGSGRGHSPDGHWLLYGHRQSATISELFVVGTSGDELGEPFLLGEVPMATSCIWSPDSVKLVCHSYQTTETRLTYFDLSRTDAAPQEFLAKSGSVPTWLNDALLAFTHMDGELMFVDTSGPIVGHPMATGVLGGIDKLSSADDRAIVTQKEQGSITAWALVDLKTLAHVTLPEHDRWTFSPSLEAAVAADYGASTTDTVTNFYYDLSGLDAVLSDTRVTDGASTGAYYLFPSGQFAGERFFELREGRPCVTTLDVGGVKANVHSGDLPIITELTPSPDGTWVALGHTEMVPGSPYVFDRWVAPVLNDSLQTPTMLDPAIGSGSLRFSPDSSKLVVAGQNGSGSTSTPSPVVLYGLSDPESIQKWTLDLPYDWSGIWWSDDSSYVGFIGGASVLSERPLYVVDALDPERGPRLIVTCSSNPAPQPGCPMSLLFQP